MRSLVTTANLRHAAGMLRFGHNPAATVYDSIGSEFFLALDDGWLNLGLWEGDGSDPSEAGAAVRRLVTRMAQDLPAGGDVLDVGNGLAAQDPVIADVSQARSLTALNITLSQLRAGRERLAAAHGNPVNGDASRMPFAAECFDGVISVGRRSTSRRACGSSQRRSGSCARAGCSRSATSRYCGSRRRRGSSSPALRCSGCGGSVRKQPPRH